MDPVYPIAVIGFVVGLLWEIWSIRWERKQRKNQPSITLGEVIKLIVVPPLAAGGAVLLVTIGVGALIVLGALIAYFYAKKG